MPKRSPAQSLSPDTHGNPTGSRHRGDGWGNLLFIVFQMTFLLTRPARGPTAVPPTASLLPSPEGWRPFWSFRATSNLPDSLTHQRSGSRHHGQPQL